MGLSCKLLRRESAGGTTADVWQVEDTSDPDEVKYQIRSGSPVEWGG